MSNNLAIDINQLSKCYRNHKQALDNINLKVHAGDFFGLIGPNGAGKTTLISILTSLARKDDGAIKIFGIDLDQHPTKAKQMIGVVPQEINFQTFETPWQIILTQAGYYGIKQKEAAPWAEELLHKMHLWHKKDMQARTLSGGMKRRLMIARALVNKPRLLFLDEPTAGVDIEIRRSMWDLMREINKKQNTTIVLTTHYLEEAENLCNHIAVINDGKIIQSTSTKELLKTTLSQNYILDTETKQTAPIEINGDLDLQWLDAQTCLLKLHEHQTIHDAVAILQQHNIKVLSLKNETNRLEQVIHELISNKQEGS